MNKREHLYSLYIISRSGSLLYYHSFPQNVSRLSTDDAIIIASTFHAMHTISASGIIPPPSQLIDIMDYDNIHDYNDALPPDPKINPELVTIEPTAGISSVEAGNYTIHCMQTLSGLKIMCLSSPLYPSIKNVLQTTYILYSDYVLKHPSYELGMPIRIETFETQLLNSLAASVPSPS